MWLGACATPPKPTALVSYEDLKRDPNLEDTRRRFPDLVGSSDQYGDRATKEWQSNNLEDSTQGRAAGGDQAEDGAGAQRAGAGQGAPADR